jgi:hypothetical protein
MPGKQILTSSGKRGLRSDGKRAVTDASGNCPECCGCAPLYVLVPCPGGDEICCINDFREFIFAPDGSGDGYYWAFDVGSPKAGQVLMLVSGTWYRLRQAAAGDCSTVPDMPQEIDRVWSWSYPLTSSYTPPEGTPQTYGLPQAQGDLACLMCSSLACCETPPQLVIGTPSSPVLPDIFTLSVVCIDGQAYGVFSVALPGGGYAGNYSPTDAPCLVTITDTVGVPVLMGAASTEFTISPPGFPSYTFTITWSTTVTPSTWTEPHLRTPRAYGSPGQPQTSITPADTFYLWNEDGSLDTNITEDHPAAPYNLVVRCTYAELP